MPGVTDTISDGAPRYSMYIPGVTCLQCDPGGRVIYPLTGKCRRPVGTKRYPRWMDVSREERYKTSD